MASEEMKDDDIYCPHKASVDGLCRKCNIYLCKKCQISDHFDHIEQIEGLETILSKAIHEYESMSSTLHKNLLTSSAGLKEGAIDETLLQVEKKISDEYDKLLKDIKTVEEDQATVIYGNMILGKIQSLKDGLEKEDFKALVEFDKKLGNTITQLLNALESEKFESVSHLLTEGAKEDFLNQSKVHEAYYDKQKQFLKQVGVVKAVKPKLTYNSQIVDDLIQVKGVHEEVVRTFLFDPKDNSVYVYHPKTKIVKKNDLKTKLAIRKYAQAVLEDGGLFICGGKRKQKEICGNSYLYVEAVNKLEIRAYMAQERASHAIAVRKEAEIYIAGGESLTGLISTAEVYDVKTNKWRNLPSMSEAKKNLSLYVFADKYLYAIGGLISTEINTVEVLNLVDMKDWEKKTIVNAPNVEKAGVVQISDNQLLVFGGKTAGKKTQNSMIYDLSNGIAFPKAALPVAAGFNKSDTRKIDGMVYSTGNTKGRTFIYDATSNQWTMITDKDYTLKYNWD